MKQTFTLQYPIDHQGQRYTSLSLRRTNAGDMETLTNGQKNDFNNSIKLLADLTEQSPELIKALDTVDYFALTEIVANFIKKT